MEDIKNIVASFEIVRYRHANVNGDSKIIIDMVKALDAHGRYIKFVKLKDVEPYLWQYPVSFKKKFPEKNRN